MPSVLRYFILCAWLPLLLAAGHAGAGAFAIDPVRISLSDARPSAVMRIENRSDATMTLQLQAMSWTQSDNHDRLTPSRDLLATPQVFRLKAGQVQVVRVALLRPADERRELSYRLLLDEVPPAPAADFRGLQMALRISMPIFVMPRDAVAPALGARLIERDGQRLLALANRGHAHLQLNSFSLQRHLNTLQPAAASAGKGNVAGDAAGTAAGTASIVADPDVLFTHGKNLYLLPGQQRELPLPAALPLSPDETLTLHAHTPGGRLEFHVPPAAH